MLQRIETTEEKLEQEEVTQKPTKRVRSTRKLSTFEKLKANLQEGIFDENVLHQTATLIESGKNILILGAIGSGKLELAKTICQIANRGKYQLFNHTMKNDEENYLGYFEPTLKGFPKFVEGDMLKAIIDKKWVIFEDFNTANLHNFLPIANIQLKKTSQEAICQESEITLSLESGNGTYKVPKDWRFIATVSSGNEKFFQKVPSTLLQSFGLILLSFPDFGQIKKQVSFRVKDTPLEKYTDLLLHFIITINSKGMPVGPILLFEFIDFVNNLLHSMGQSSIELSLYLGFKTIISPYLLKQSGKELKTKMDLLKASSTNLSMLEQDYFIYFTDDEGVTA